MEPAGEALGELIVALAVGLFKGTRFLLKAAVVPLLIIVGLGIKNGSKHTGKFTKKIMQSY